MNFFLGLFKNFDRCVAPAISTIQVAPNAQVRQRRRSL
jgi:hypothetical protein